VLSLEFPVGPDTPFADGVLILDLLRCLIVAFAVFTVVGSVLTIASAPALSQKIRFAAMVVLMVIVALTELGHLGDYANWRLALSLIATGLAAWGTWAYLRYETPGAGERQAARHERRRKRRRHGERAGLLDH
jgi:hypothetical protein